MNFSFQKNQDPKFIFTAKQKKYIALFIVFLFLALFFDNQILNLTGAIRLYPVDAFMLFMTDFGLLYCVIVLAVYLLVQKKIRELLLILLTGGLSLEVSYLAKVIFQTPRPFASAGVATIPLTQASGFSMPSLHTAFCFAFWPYVHKTLPKKWRPVAYAIIILIAFSRLYLGVHYASDLFAGGLIGYTLGKTWIYLEEKYSILEWFAFHVKDKFELRRQVAHMFIGSIIVFLLKLQLLNSGLLFIILVLGGALSLIVRKYRIKTLDRILFYFERPEDIRYFPGKGSFFLVLGAFLTVTFFQRDIALAAISIMAVGDAITTIIGTYFGKIKNPLNPRKHLEGTFLAIIVSTLVAFFFVDFKTAFYGSVVGMLFESITVRFISKIIDDNVIIPLVAAAAMTLLY